jgi:hypothetical protein
MKRRGQWITPWLGPARATRTLSICVLPGQARRRAPLARRREGYHSRSVDAASSPFWSLPHDPVPVTAVALACVAALRGRTGESEAWERWALEKAEELDFPSGPFSSNFVTVYLAWIRMITGNLEEARELGRRTIELAERFRFDYFQLLGGRYKLLPEADRPCDVAELEMYGEGMNLVGHGPSARRTSVSSPGTTTTSATPVEHSVRSKTPST